MKYPELTLNVDNTQINSYIASEKGDIANHYTPLQNLDSETGRGDFTSSGLNFDAQKPIQMDIVPEYDGSVNVIMNDDKHLPKLINSGFSVEENNTYKIPEHNGNAVTNVYDDTTLEGDTALFKLYKSIPTLTFNGIQDGGSFPCGSFVFYFRLADADGNVTNIIQESGVVQVHMGQVNSKHVRMGQENENSLKQISFTLTDLDKSFDYVKVLYEKTSGNGKDGAVSTSYYMVDRNYPIRNGKCDILITGAEGLISELTLQDIQTQYADIQTAKTQAIEQNTLFLGNVSAYEVQHKKIQQLVWRIIPKEITQSDLGHISSQYDFQNGCGYYDVKNVYNFTGYWADEIYKFGICFIYGNNHVSKVFPLQGIDFNKLGSANIDQVYCKNYNSNEEFDSNNPEYWETDTDDHFFHKEYLTNSQGVIRFSKGSDIDTKASYNIKARGIQFTLNSDIIKGLADLNIVGLFFVRQKRVPTILGQGVVIGLTSKETGSLPVIQNSGSYCAKSFLDENRMLTSRGGDINNLSYVTTQALLLPDAELQTPIYNDILNSEEFCLERVGHFDKSVVVEDAGAFKNFSSNTGDSQLVKLTSVPQNSKILTNGTDYFSTLAGYPEEAWRVVDIKQIWNETPPQQLTTSTSLVRGQFGYYVGMSANSFVYGDVVNIKQKKFLDESAYELAFMERFQDATPYFTICRRINLPTKGTSVKCYGGDCFMSVFTHKMCSNFADTELPTNTKIIDSKCWAKNFIVRTTAYCQLTTHSNVSKSNDGFYLSNISPSTKKGVPTYNHEIVEEATLDVAAYPTEVMNEGDLNEKVNGTTYSSIVQSYKDSAQTDATDSSYITYQEDVIIGQTVDPDEYKDDGYQKASWIKAFLAPGAFPLTTIIQLAKAAKYRRIGISSEQAFGFLSKNQKEPMQTGVSVFDALIRVKYYKNHNFVTRGLTNINRSDVNAVSFGQWITFPICSSINLAFRDVDMSNSTEEAAHNHKRTFYPYEGQNAELHLLESQTVNGGARKSISTNGIQLYPSVPYIKQEFFNRIYWSRPNNTQSIINSYRLVYDRQFKEYNKEYGSITKIIPQGNRLIVIFQHGIGQLNIDTSPKTETETSQYMAMRSVLSGIAPISEMYGSMWQDSVIITPQHAIYGVDTVARKIWRFGQNLELLSENHVEKFLNDFIDLSEFDFTEYLGHVNVKTHYNAFKYDVIFTFYKDKVTSWQMTKELTDDIREYILQGRVEIEDGNKPGQSNLIQNIQISDIKDNQIYVTYQVSKKIDDAYVWEDLNETFTLRKGRVYSSTNNILENTAKPLTWEKGTTWALCYNEALNQFTTFYDWYPLLSENIDNIYFSFDKDAYETTLNGSIDGIEAINVENSQLEITDEYKSLIDKNFQGTIKVIENISDKDAVITVSNPKGIICYYEWNGTEWEFKTIYGINKNKQIIAITSNIVLKPQQTIADLHTVDIDYLVKCGAINADKTKFINNTVIDQYYLKNSSTIPSMSLWKHGQAGLFDNQGEIKPTNWYGKQHEFNFEFIAKGDDAAHKIFNNLQILSNKAEPAKFEYEVVGEAYEWWDYKPIIEWINKQEIPTGADDTYWYDYVIGKTAEQIQQVYSDFPDFYPEEQYENGSAAINNTRIITKLPYLKMKLTDKKGSPEVPVYDYDGISPKDNWDTLEEHPVNKYAFNCNEECLVKDKLLNELRVHSEQLGNNVKKYGRTRGNMQYREDRWKVEIRPIKFTWYYKENGELKTFITETRHRDKYIKIKVRYSGKDLAIISAIYTLFNDSFS